MRVLILSWEYSPHVIGGLGRHVVDLTTAQCTIAVDEDVKIDLLTPRYAGGEQIEQTAARVTIHRIDVPWLSGDLYFSTAANNDLLTRYAQQCFDDHPPDLIHVHDWQTAIAGLALKERWNIPMIVTFHSIHRGRSSAELSQHSWQQISQFEHDIGQKATHVIVCSHFMRQAAHEQLGIPLEKLTVIPNGVRADQQAVNTLSDLATLRTKYAPNGQTLLLYVGFITHSKGVLVLIRAMPAILARHPNTKLLVVGEHGHKLQPLAFELGVEHAIDFLGYVSDHERDCLYQIADAVVIPSLYEPFGIVALEAMAFGANVIASNVGGLSEVIEHMRTGLLVEPDKPASIAHAVDVLLADPEASEQRRRNASKSVDLSYRWGVIAKRTIHLYRRIAVPVEGVPEARERRIASPGGLTEREVEVLRLWSQGLSNAKIAERLVVSVYTVNAHLRNIYNKVGSSDRSAVIDFIRHHEIS